MSSLYTVTSQPIQTLQFDLEMTNLALKDRDKWLFQTDLGQLLLICFRFPCFCQFFLYSFCINYTHYYHFVNDFVYILLTLLVISTIMR